MYRTRTAILINKYYILCNLCVFSLQFSLINYDTYVKPETEVSVCRHCLDELCPQILPCV